MTHIYKQCRKKLDTVFREEVQRRREDTTVDANKDLISGLMEMEDEHGKKLCDDEVVDEQGNSHCFGYFPIFL